MEWSEQVAIVTGAGSGIGRAIAERFAAQGVSVVIADINEQTGTAAADALATAGARAHFSRTDVSQPDEMERLVTTTVKRFGRLDIMVNNAGVNFVKPFLETSVADWQRVINIDLQGTFLGCKFAVQQFVAQGDGGCIVNISSVHSVATLPGAAPYAAAKGGVTQLTRALAIELGAHRIRVNAVCPGLINTRIWQDIKASSSQGDAIKAYWQRGIPLRREGEPEEIAQLVTWICSDQASYVTGANLMIDGGMTAMLMPFEA